MGGCPLGPFIKLSDFFRASYLCFFVFLAFSYIFELLDCAFNLMELIEVESGRFVRSAESSNVIFVP